MTWVFCQRRVRERGRGHVLGQHVEAVGDRIASVVVRPVRGPDLPGPASEEERVRALVHRGDERPDLLVGVPRHPSATLEPAAPVLVGASLALVHAVQGQEHRGGQLHGQSLPVTGSSKDRRPVGAEAKRRAAGDPIAERPDAAAPPEMPVQATMLADGTEHSQRVVLVCVRLLTGLAAAATPSGMVAAFPDTGEALGGNDGRRRTPTGVTPPRPAAPTCGEVITPDDATYDDARRLWNAVHDRRPAVIVRPTTAHQRSPRPIRFAREHDLEIVVQSGGHSRRRAHRTRTAVSSSTCRAMRGVEVGSADPDRPIERRRAPRRARHRRPGARPRLPDRRRRPHRRRRADPRWGSGPPAAPLRADDRQPDRRRDRDRRRPPRPRDRDRRARALLGPARCRLELRDRDRLRVPAPAVRTRSAPGRPDLPGDADPGRVDRLPRLRGERARMRSR